MIPKIRLDAALVERGLVSSRQKAAALIMAGEVLVDGDARCKPGQAIAATSHIEVHKKYPFVSRGAFKIAKAVSDFSLMVSGKQILDIGISTGGFSDYLLQHGARRVLGVDVNILQVAERLRADHRVILLKKNARYLCREDIEIAPDIIVIDVSFISLRNILPALACFPDSLILALVKPQFEAQKGRVGKHGVVRDARKRSTILLGLKRDLENLGYGLMGFTSAGLKGRKGNQEYFFLLRYGNSMISDDTIKINENQV